MREISCRYCKIYYLILCKAKGYMVESHNTQFSTRCSKDVLSTFSGRLSENCVLWIYLNMISYCKILIGHFMTSYEILWYPTISFWNSRMLLSGISVGSPLSIWNNLSYPQDKMCCVGESLWYKDRKSCKIIIDYITEYEIWNMK